MPGSSGEVGLGPGLRRDMVGALGYISLMTRTPARPFRSRDWFAAPGRSDMAALYLERFMNYGLTADELRSGKPIIGIAQTGSDLSPCNRIHLDLAVRVKEGIRDAG